MGYPLHFKRLDYKCTFTVVHLSRQIGHVVASRAFLNSTIYSTYESVCFCKKDFVSDILPNVSVMTNLC